MNSRDVAVLAFKLLGVWFAAGAVTGLAGVPYLWHAEQPGSMRMVGFVAVLFPSALTIVVGGLLWINAEGLATRVFGPHPADVAANVFGDGPADAAPRDRLEMQPLFALALSVIGVLMIAEATPMLVYGATMFASSRQTSILGPDPAQQALVWDAAAKSNFAAACTRFVIGVALLAGPARLSAAYAGIRKEFRGTLAEDGSSTGKPTS